MNSYLLVFLHTAAIYACLVLGFRFVGRRLLGQLTLVDLVVITLMGSAVETSMVAGDTSLVAGLVSAGTLLTLDRALAAALWRSKRLRRLVGGAPVLLVHNGRLLEDHLRRAGLTEGDVLEALRERGESDVENVLYAVLEVDGEINIIPKGVRTLKGGRTVRT